MQISTDLVRGQYGLVQISADLVRGQSGLVQISAGSIWISADECRNCLGVGFLNSEKMTFLEFSDMY